MTGYFDIVWTDNSMIWTLSDYDNAWYIILPEDAIWKPPLINSNSAREFSIFNPEDLSLYVLYDGQVKWLPAQNLKFTCDIDITYFPFDTQECTMQIIAWGYSTFDITFYSSLSTVHTSSYSTNSEWELSKTSVNVSNTVTPTVRYTFYFKRRPMFLLMTLIIPVIFLALLNIGVFLLPTESGERFGFSVTLLLAVVVFLTIAQGLLPASAVPRLSAICVTLMINLVMSGLIVGSVIMSSRFYYKTEDEPIPNWMKKIVTYQLCCRGKNQVHDLRNGEKVDHCIEYNGNAKKITWQDVSKAFDTISLIFYIVAFIAGNLMFIIDVAQVME
ncbi:neuronal acetylcholine receptor subunit alpha-3-like [Mytilus californianus]|uniref:neuronal acetylcholine receptor subunit alpha-3-like n=1 Tax=Mytilus californianus TaxID=6549 RepID=UPI002245744E|nr:neuronal acetylcholine receptor subunit alpha-3-like [Mytilus californianus]